MIRLAFLMFLVISKVAFSESEEWRTEHTLGIVAIRATHGDKGYFNSSGNKGHQVNIYWDTCNRCSEQFQLILINEGPVISNLRKEIEDQTSIIQKQDDRIRKLECIIGVYNEDE